MTVFSIKNPFWNSFAIGIFALLFAPTTSWADKDSDYLVELQTRIAYHTRAPRDLASLRERIDAEKRFSFAPFSAVISGHIIMEGAFGTNASRYNSAVREKESSEILLRDAYLQYKGSNVLVRIGSQQVVWGEAFGFYFADVVNPKDMRDFGLQDLSKQRLPVPMLMTKLLASPASFQIVFIPKPYFNKMPALGNDFAYPFQAALPGATLTLEDERTAPLDPENFEVGAKASLSLDKVDLGIFYFHYFSRTPNYRLNASSPTAFTLSPLYTRLDTVGITGTADADAVVLRWELLLTAGKLFDVYGATGITQVRSMEHTGVFGVDYAKIPNWRLGLQLSDTYVEKGTAVPGLSQHRPLVSLITAGPVVSDHSFESILSYLPQDGSSLAQLKYFIPASSQIELVLGADLLFGGLGSRFGVFRDASRAYFLFKAFLGKG